MKDIVFTLQFDDTSANQRANEYLAKGWTLVAAGTVCVGHLENDQADYGMAYVVGANKEQYAAYQKEQESLKDAEKGVNSFLNSNNAF